MSKGLEEMSLNDIFADAVTYNEEDEQSGSILPGSQRNHPFDRNRAALHDPHYYWSPPPKVVKPTTPPVKTENLSLKFSGVRRTIVRNAGMLRYALGEHIPALMRSIDLDTFGGCNGACGLGEGRVLLGDELKDLAKKPRLTGDNKPDYFRVLSYISELLSGSLKMILKADYAMQYLAGEKFSAKNPTGTVTPTRKVGLPNSSRSATPKREIPTPSVPCPSEPEIAGDINQLLSWLTESSKSLDQVEPLPGLEQATLPEPSDLLDFDAFLAEVLGDGGSVQPPGNLPAVDMSDQPDTSSSVSSPLGSAASPSSVIISIPDQKEPDVESVTVGISTEQPPIEKPKDSVPPPPPEALPVPVSQASKEPKKLANTPPSEKASTSKPTEVVSTLRKSSPAKATQPVVEKPKILASSSKVPVSADPEAATSSSKTVVPTRSKPPVAPPSVQNPVLPLPVESSVKLAPVKIPVVTPVRNPVPVKKPVASTSVVAIVKSPAQPGPTESIPPSNARSTKATPTPSTSRADSPPPSKKPASGGSARASVRTAAIASASVPAARHSGTKRKREKSPASDDGKPSTTKFIPVARSGSSNCGNIVRRVSARQADQQSHLCITSTSSSASPVCIVVSADVPEEVRNEIEGLNFSGVGWKVSRCNSSAVSHAMTHYVVSAPDRHLRGHRGRANCPKRSFSLLKAIVMQKWIVTCDWLFTCAKTGMKIPEMTYEVRGTEETAAAMEGGPKRARLNQKGNLFADCVFVFDSTITIENSYRELEDLVEVAGARRQQRMPAAARVLLNRASPLKHAPEDSEISNVRYFHLRDTKKENGEVQQPNTAPTCGNSASGSTTRMKVTLEWLLDSIDAFNVLPAPLGSKYRW